MTTRSLQQTVHVACRELNIDADTRHDLQLSVTGKASMRDMDDGDLKLLVSRLKEIGSTVRANKAKRHPIAPRADLRMIHVLWSKLGDKGVLKRPGRPGLNAFIRSRFEAQWGSVPLDVDALRDSQQIHHVIEALKNWGERVDIDFDWSEHRQ